MDSSGLDSSGVDSSGADSSGLDSSGVDSSTEDSVVVSEVVVDSEVVEEVDSSTVEEVEVSPEAALELLFVEHPAIVRSIAAITAADMYFFMLWFPFLSKKLLCITGCKLTANAAACPMFSDYQPIAARSAS